MIVASVQLKEFSRAIDLFMEGELPREILKFKKVIGLELLTSVVMRTPVKTGRARAGWNVTRTRPSRAVNNERYDKDGGATISRGAAHVSKSAEGEHIYITNNVHYITTLDTGTSDQAPEGIGRLAVEEVTQRHA
jgi:hypothetical protein